MSATVAPSGAVGHDGNVIPATCEVCGLEASATWRLGCLVSLGWFAGADESGYRWVHRACGERVGLIRPVVPRRR